jgi:hypothetical protein
MGILSWGNKRSPGKEYVISETEDFKAIAALIHQLLPPGAPDFLKATQNSITQMAQSGHNAVRPFYRTQLHKGRRLRLIGTGDCSRCYGRII